MLGPIPLLALTLAQLPTAPQTLTSFVEEPIVGFGYTLDVSGDHAAVTTSAQLFPPTSPGLVMTYQRSGSGPWEPNSVIEYQPASANFPGFSIAVVALDEGGLRPTLVIGQPEAIDPISPQRFGQVLIYERFGDAWTLTQTLLGDPFDSRFGSDVAIDGDTILIGEEGASYMVHEYVRSAATGAWELQSQFSPPGIVGSASQNAPEIAIAGDLVVVGTPLDGDETAFGGAAQVFRRSAPGGPFEFEARLSGPNPYFYSQHGFDVDVDVSSQGEERVVLGSNVGRVFVFRTNDQGDWELDANLTAFDDRPGGFGLSVNLEENLILLGANGRHGAAPSSGAALVYALDPATSTWEARSLLHPGLGPDAVGPLGRAGFATVLDGGTALVSAPSSSEFGGALGSGVIYSYDLSSRIGVAHCRGEVNSTGSYASIAAFGSVSLADEELGFDVVALPPGALGFPLTSASRAQVPGLGGGAGNLCLGGALSRLSLFLGAANASGEVSVSLDFANLPSTVQFLPGTTWSFQWWNRDLTAAGPSSNTSDAVEIRFEP